MSKLVLFQGDSITDAWRSREYPTELGIGYSQMAASEVMFDHPGEYTFLNRGVSGNRIVDLYARMKADIINLKPDYMSILIGVNDVWHELNFQDGVSAEKYERIYNDLITEVKEALPNIKIMIMEPFVLPGGGTRSTEEKPDKWDIFYREVRKRAECARRVAEKHNLLFVPLQEKYEALNKKCAGNWLTDGVHPSCAGYQLLKREWLKAFETIR